MLFMALALMGAQTSALDAAEKAAGKTSPKTGSKAPSAQMQSLLQNCDAHKFETVIEVDAGGAVKQSHVKLCGTEGQSDADWIRTLKDAVVKTQANQQMAPAVRHQIVTAIDNEIARLEGKPPPATAALPPARSATGSSGLGEYAALPPLPTAPPPVVHVLPGGSAELPALAMPRMTFSCMIPEETADGPCTEFTRDMLMTVRADEDLPDGTSLRFVRSGDPRADVKLAQLKRGKSVQFSLPPEVCSHAAGGRLEIRVVRTVPATGPAGEEVGQDGPYNLRC